MLESVWQDLRYASRRLSQDLRFTAAAVLTLALAIGANTAVFSVVDAVLLRPLAAADPGGLVALYGFDRAQARLRSLSYPDILDYREGNPVFSGLAAYLRVPLHVAAGGQAERVTGEAVSRDYFEILGIRPSAGRAFSSRGREDERTAVMLSEAAARRLFGSAAQAVGRPLALSGRSFTVLGVLPPEFKGVLLDWMGAPDLFFPIDALALANPVFQTTEFLTRRDAWGLMAVGRLKSGVTLEQAEAAMRLQAGRLEQRFPETHRNSDLQLIPLDKARFWPGWRDSVERFLALLMGISGFILLIACSNLAGLLLARAADRRREVAIRLALGCSRRRLLQQLLAEAALVYLAGLGLALLLAHWMNRLFLGFEQPFRIGLSLDLQLDARVLGVTLLVSLLGTLVFGLIPILQSTRPDLVPALKNQDVGGGRRRLLPARHLLVLAQVSISVILLIGAGLFLRSLFAAARTSLGFDPSRVLLLQVDLSTQGGYGDEQARDFYRRATESVGALPGVQAVSWAWDVPLTITSIRRQIRAVGGPGAELEAPTEGELNIVSSDYFKTLGISLLQGREFQAPDLEAASRSALISQALAGRLWPGANPVGRHFRIGGDDTPHQVIGLVPDLVWQGFGEDSRPALYTLFEQKASPQMTLQVRHAGPAEELAAAIRREIQAVAPGLPVYGIRTLQSQVDKSLTQTRLLATLLSLFGLIGLVLCSVGLYGTMAGWVSQRRQEIALRIILGARPGRVRRMILGQGGRLVAGGLLLGLAGAFLLSGIASSYLYETSQTDPLTFAAVALILVATGLLACYLPARRAGRVDPLPWLRS